MLFIDMLTTSPEKFLPSGTAIESLIRVLSSGEKMSPRVTMLLILFGTSIPIADLPGIGVKNLKSGEPRATQKSSSRLSNFWTLTPWESASSYKVIDGPLVTDVTFADKLK